MASIGDEPRDPRPRWCYALEEKWQSFSDKDNDKIEERWQAVEKEGVLKKIRRERKEEKKKLKMENAANEFEKSKRRKTPLKVMEAPSGVDEVQKSLLKAIGQGETSKENTEEKEQQKEEEESMVASEQLDPDQSEDERRFRVEVMEDHLFEVDLVDMRLFPVFWKGVMLKIVRAIWFYSSDNDGHAPIPYDEDLAKDLDAAYRKARPWMFIEGNGENSELRSYSLPSMNSQGEIQFEDASCGHIFTQDLTGKLKSVIGGSLVTRGWEETIRKSKAGSNFFNQSNLPWATGKEQKEKEYGNIACSGNVQRRSEAAKAPKNAPATTSSSGEDKDSKSEGGFFKLWPSSDGLLRPGVNLLRAMGWNTKDANKEGQRAEKQETTEKGLQRENSNNDDDDDDESSGDDDLAEDRKDEPPELILIIHGIGQKMVEEWSALDFELDVERFRNVSKKAASTRALKQISRGKRAQYLPICWRKEIDFDQTEISKDNDNIYTLEDVSNSASIPIVRNVISKVIVDVPYYLSRHKGKMIKAVKAELNRTYRLFVKRNSDFEKNGGRVSLICHSLGSAIAADILSEQPTMVAPLAERTREELTSNDHLLFNVKNLIFVGSPNGFFFHLEGAQMIARRGTARTKEVAEDAARDIVGKYGCMAAESIYNCYNTTDPVAFQLSPTVDAQYARTLNPVSIPDAVPALLEALKKPRLSLSKLFDPKHPFSRSGKPAYVMEKTTHTPLSSPPESGVNTPKRNLQGERKTTIMIEEGTIQKENQIGAQWEDGKKNGIAREAKFNFERLERAERRFRALNPHGIIDFQYDSGGYNQYFDMLGAHVSYWTSSSFATFVLLQQFADYSEKKQTPSIVPQMHIKNLIPQENKEDEDSKDHDDDNDTDDNDTDDNDTDDNDTDDNDTDDNDTDDNDDLYAKGTPLTLRSFLQAMAPSGIL